MFCLLQVDISGKIEPSPIAELSDKNWMVRGEVKNYSTCLAIMSCHLQRASSHVNLL